MGADKKYAELRAGIDPGVCIPESFFSPAGEDVAMCVFMLSCIGQDQILYLDESFESLSGYTSEKLSKGGMDFWFSLMHPEDRPIVSERIVESHKMLAMHGYNEKDPRPLVLEYRAQHANGEWIWIKDTKFLISFNEKVIDKVLGKFERIGIEHLTDIDLRRRFESEGACTQLLDFALAQGNVPHLTKREKEVLQLIGEGYSTKMIADKCRISVNTVETHRRHLLEKLQVSNSMQLIKEASRIFRL